jgi:hypothetical protein
MKITKTASGKQTIKISKKEWESIGKKAGWNWKQRIDKDSAYNMDGIGLFKSLMEKIQRNNIIIKSPEFMEELKRAKHWRSNKNRPEESIALALIKLYDAATEDNVVLFDQETMNELAKHKMQYQREIDNKKRWSEQYQSGQRQKTDDKIDTGGEIADFEVDRSMGL